MSMLDCSERVELEYAGALELYKSADEARRRD